MHNQLVNRKVKFYIGDTRDKRSVNGAMKGEDYNFSAAAIKQVPSCEFFSNCRQCVQMILGPKMYWIHPLI